MERHGDAPAWAPDRRALVVDGCLVHVALQGSGPPLLLLNGIGANVDMWAPLARELPGRTLVMLDVPGTGLSPALRRPRRMPGYARLVLALLDALDLERVDVLGYSWGGALAQELARAAPERVRGLVLAATTCGAGGQPPAPWVVGAMMTPLRYWSPTYLRLIAPLTYGTPVRPEAGHVGARRRRPPTLSGYGQQLYAISGWSSRPWLRRLTAPTLVLAGRGDQLAPVRNSRILARGIPGARLEVLPGGHLLLLQDAQLPAQRIGRFLDEVIGSPAQATSAGASRSRT